ncbi:MAG: inorganic diphosphatase [Moheibacter sp.]
MLPLKSTDGYFNALIEIPAGTNKKFEFNKKSSTFEIDKRDGEERIIPYLPYFANYGFIPSTHSDTNEGGDGDPVDVFVICESLKQGTLMPIIPLGTVKLIDDGEIDYKVIAVPADEKLNLLKIKSFASLQNQFPTILQIIELWLSNYDTDPLQIDGWLNESETEKYILENLQT